MAENRIGEIRRINCLTSEMDALYHQASVKMGISDSVSIILYNLYDAGGACLLQQICKASGISKQTINSALKHLSMRGLVDLVYAEGSRKNKVAQLTKEGSRFSERFIAPALDAEVKALSTLTATERKRFEAEQPRSKAYPLGCNRDRGAAPSQRARFPPCCPCPSP